VTLNLAAPVIVNPVTRRGRQVVFQDGRYPVDSRWNDLLSPKRSLELAA
jgi:flagellar assembly factor FliW